MEVAVVRGVEAERKAASCVPAQKGGTRFQRNGTSTWLGQMPQSSGKKKGKGKLRILVPLLGVSGSPPVKWGGETLPQHLGA